MVRYYSIYIYIQNIIEFTIFNFLINMDFFQNRSHINIIPYV